MHRLTLVILCAIISFACTKKTLVVPPQLVARVQPIVEQCIKESGSRPDSLKLMLDWNSQDDMASKNFIYCFATKSGYVDKTEHLDLDKFLALLPSDVDQREDFVNMVHECNKITGEVVVEKIYQMAACFQEKSPFHFTI